MKPRRFHISRRRFLKATALSSLPLWTNARALAENPAPRTVSSPNDRPGLALVGCGGMGGVDAQSAARFGDFVAVCDVDEVRLNQMADKLAERGKRPDTYTDFRRALDRNDVDIIIQATPDHWHTLVNLAASRAGKDVYSEKPLTLTVDEGKRLVREVRARGTILQTGSQQRSTRFFRMACELVRNSRIGALKEVQIFLPAGLREGPFAAAPVPGGLLWDCWQGQAPATDYVPQRCHGTFRFWFDYSGGTLTDWGAHHIDIARWAMGEDVPVEVEGRVLAPPIAGGYTTFSEYAVTITYGGGVQHRIQTTTDDNTGGAVVNPEGQRNGIRFQGTDGWIWVTRGDLQASDEDLLFEPLPEGAVRLETSRDHMENFFNSVRSRQDSICPVEVGHRSASVCHLANIALRTGRKLQWDAAREEFTGEGSPEANGYLSRPMRKPYDYTFGA